MSRADVLISILKIFLTVLGWFLWFVSGWVWHINYLNRKKREKKERLTIQTVNEHGDTCQQKVSVSKKEFDKFMKKLYKEES